MARPSRDMLTTGLVGSYLLASAWGLMLLGVIIILFQGTSSFDIAMGASMGGFAVVGGLLWLGGAVCEGVGWVGLGRLYPGLPTFVGWLEGSLPVLTLLILAVVVAMLDFSEGVAHVMMILQLTHFLLAMLWMLTHGPKRQTVPAAVGYGLAFVCGVVLYLLAMSGSNVETLGLLLVVALLAGGVMAHLATGLFFGKSRALADSVNTF